MTGQAEDDADRLSPFVAGLTLGWLDGFARGYRVGETPTCADLDLRADAEADTYREGQPPEVWAAAAVALMAQRTLLAEVSEVQT